MIKGYITNLGKYNEGYLIGKWITFPIDEDELNEVLKEIGCEYIDEDGNKHNHEYEEYFFTDYELEIDGLDFGEYTSISRLNEVAEYLESLPSYDIAKLKAILEVDGGNIEDINLDDYIFYENMSIEDLAWEMVEDYSGGVSSDLRIKDFFVRHINIQSVVREMEDDRYHETDDGVLVSF